MYYGDYIFFILAIILFLAEVYAIILHFIGLFVGLNPVRRDVPPLPAELPSIDVFIPTYNEDIAVAVTTAIACRNFDYPAHLVNVYILDDGCRLPRLNTPQLQAALLERHKQLFERAREIGVTYLTREDGEQAKAGMLNAAFNGKAFRSIVQGEDGVYRAGERVETKGEFILILDCDHVPTRDMPNKVIGHFADPKVFLIQTPHFMLNPDPVRKNWGDNNSLPCESWLFYQSIQRGLDHWNSAFFCGSAAFLRRSILEETGGLCGDTITEDCETALALHAKGYRSIYVDTPLVAGLAPESVVDMMKQRQRWCQGMLQIFLLKNPLFRRGLTLPQRLCYTNCCLSWFFPFPRLIFFMTPFAFLLFNINIYNASVEQVLIFAAPHIFASVLLSSKIQGRLRLFLQSETLEMLQCFFLIPAIFSVLIAPKKPVFLTTRKGITLEKDTLSPLAWPFFVAFFLCIAGFANGMYMWYTNSLLHEIIYVAFFWNSYNIAIILFCLGAVWERQQRQGFHRVRFSEAVSVNGISGTLDNFSISGILVTLEDAAKSAEFTPGQECIFRAHLLETRIKLIRVNPNSLAAAFSEKSHEKAIINYVYGDSQRWQSIMDNVLQHSGYIRLSLLMIKEALSSSLRALGGGLRRGFLPLVFIGVGFALLLPHEGNASTMTRTLSSLVDEERFIVRTDRGEMRIPLYLAPRANIQSASLSISYSRPPYFPAFQRPMYVVIDEQQVEGIMVPGVDDEALMVFVLPVEKLVPGMRTIFLHVHQSLPGLLDGSANDAAANSEIKTLADSGALWTNIDLRRSNVAIQYIPRALKKEERDDFRLIFDQQVLAPKSLHFVLPEMTEPMVMRAFSVMQRIALALGNRPLRITLSDAVVEDKDCIIIGDDAREVRDSSPENLLFVRLIEEDIPPLAENRRYVLDRGTTQSFKDLGFPTLTFRPWYSSRSTRFLIPSVTTLIPNRYLNISLDFAYSAGLHRDSRLEVYVNEETLTWVRLIEPEGMNAQNYRVNVPTSLLKKGFNVLRIKPDLIAASGNKWESAEQGNLFATVFNSSTLTLPDTGVLVRIPDLSTIFTDGYPFSGDGILHLEEPSNSKIAAMLNLQALVVQHRGVVGKKVGLSFAPWVPSPRNAIVFSIDPKLPQNKLRLTASLIPDTDHKVVLSLLAPSEEGLLQGTFRLWDPEVQKRISGTEAMLDYVTGEVEVREGEFRIISTAGPFTTLVYYTNNFPYLACGIIALIAFLFSVASYKLVRDSSK